MKRLKVLTGLLAIVATLFITASSVKVLADDTPGGDVTPPGDEVTEPGEEGKDADPLSDYAIEYSEFRIKCRKGVYFQFVKKTQPGNLKTNAWIPATVSGDRAFIDFSEIKKTSYVALTMDPANTTTDTVLTIECPIKSLKANVNYLSETPQSLFEALSLLEVKTVAGATDTLETDSTAAEATAFKAKYAFQWKRGVNGSWKDAIPSEGSPEGEFALEFRDVLRHKRTPLRPRKRMCAGGRNTGHHPFKGSEGQDRKDSPRAKHQAGLQARDPGRKERHGVQIRRKNIFCSCLRQKVKDLGKDIILLGQREQ